MHKSKIEYVLISQKVEQIQHGIYPAREE
jgi:hypothetical protein